MLHLATVGSAILLKVVGSSEVAGLWALFHRLLQECRNLWHKGKLWSLCLKSRQKDPCQLRPSVYLSVYFLVEKL